MDEKFLSELNNYGLSEKEAKIYLGLLELELATVFEVAKHSGVNRSSAYVVLENLKKKELVGVTGHKVQKYFASSPEALLQTVKDTSKKIENLTENIESVIPELKALYKGTKKRPIVKIFEGENAAKEVYWTLFTTNAKEQFAFANPVEILKRIPDFVETYEVERGKRGIKLFLITPDSNEVIDFFKRIIPADPYELVFIPENKFGFSSDLGICADKILIASPRQNFGIVIESQEIADILKNIFYLAWKTAQRMNNNSKKLSTYK